MRTTTRALFGALTLALATGGAGAADLGTAAPAARDALARAELAAARRSWAGAIAAYREAIAAHPGDAALHNRLGMCYQRAGEASAARAEYRRAIELRKGYAAPWSNLGTLDHARGRYRAAISEYGRAIRIEATDAVFHKNLGSAWLARGDVGKALEAWTEALRLDPASFESDAVKVPAAGVDLARQCYLVAKVFAARGDVERALEYLARARGAGFTDFARLERDRDFAAVLGDPRYASVK